MQSPVFASRSIAALVLVWCAHPVHAVAPAIPENIICSVGHIFTGRIVAVESRDCKLRSPGWCSPRDAMVVDVLINRVLTTVPLPPYLGSKFSVETGRVFKMYVFSFGYGANRYPALLREEEVPVPMSDKWLNDRLAGKALVFSAGSQPSGLSDGPTLLIGNTLPMESVPWVEETLSTSCGRPGPIRKSEGLRPNESLDTETQQLEAASPQVLRSGQLQR